MLSQVAAARQVFKQLGIRLTMAVSGNALELITLFSAAT